MNQRPSDIYLPNAVSDSTKRKFDQKAEAALLASAWDVMTADLAEGEEARKELPAIKAKLEKLEAKQPVLRATLEQPKAQPKSYQKPIGASRMLSLAAAAQMVKTANRGSRIDAIMGQLLPGTEYREARKSAAALLVKSATDPATTTAAGWAAELVQSEVRQFWDDQKETSVIAQLTARGLLLNYQGANSITVPTRGPKSIVAAWVAEKASIPVDHASFGAQTIFRTKKAVITAATNDLISTTNPSFLPLVEGYIRDDLAASFDAELISTTAAVVGVSPAGLLVGAPNQASAGGTLANIVTDIKYLRSQLKNVVRDPVLIMSTDNRLALECLLDTSGDNFPFRDELQRSGTVLGYPVLSSPYVNDSIVAMIDASNYTLVSDPVLVDASSAATIVMTGAVNPAPIMGDGGTPPTVNDEDMTGTSVHISDAAGTTPPSEVRSMFQTDSVALRLVAPTSWAMMLSNKAAYVTGVSW